MGWHCYFLNSEQQTYAAILSFDASKEGALDIYKTLKKLKTFIGAPVEN